MNDTVSTQLESLYENANRDVQAYLLSDELDKAVAVLGKLHGLQIGKYLPLKNTITLILLGAIEPKDAVSGIQTHCELGEQEAQALAHDLDETVFQKVRLSILGKTTGDVKQLKIVDTTPSKDELRKEILDTTKRAEDTPLIPRTPVPRVTLQAGSRSQLLEQLHVLETIPDDEEVEARLAAIKEQLSALETTTPKPETTALDSNIALKEFMFGEKGDTVAEVNPQAATYSKAPTSYNIDPYRELAE